MKIPPGMLAAASRPPPLDTPVDGPLYVHPGRLVLSREGASLVTVVGSGLAICLWDPMHNVGGMAHFLLPDAGGGPKASRYGDVAMRTLVDELVKLGASATSMRARLYGGSAPPIDSTSGHVGDRNVAQALAFVRERGITLVERGTGGTGGRKVVFNPLDGGAQVTKVGA